MAHSFVIAKLAFKRSVYWTSYYGAETAIALKTRPFLALRVHARDLEPDDYRFHSQHTYLFAVSTHKPTGIRESCYMALGPAAKEEKRVLVVHPPLPSEGRPLYVHTYPWLAEYPVSTEENSSGSPKNAGPHHVEPSSFRAFCRSVLYDDLPTYRELERLQRLERASSGGDEPVEENWESWSGRSATEGLHKPIWNIYEYLEFKNLSIAEPPSIYQELALYDR